MTTTGNPGPLPSAAGDRPCSRRSHPLAAVGAGILLAAALLLQPSATVSAQQQQPAPPSGGGGGGSQPIEIVADSLVVEQEKRIATFTGNVDAAQGDLRLRADRLLVYYDRGADAGDGQAAAGGAGAAAGDQSIRRIEAAGNVSLASPGETARGDRGTYDVPGGQVVLEGNVVLTRNDNVIRGAKLDSNLRTGVSTVTAAQPGASGKPDQRVRALFAPAARGAAKPAPGSAAGGEAAKPEAKDPAAAAGRKSP